MKYNDEGYVVIQYCSTTNKPLDKIEIKGEYIKAQFVEQNETGDVFAIPYSDNGIFHILTFGKVTEEMLKNNIPLKYEDFNVNEKFGIDNHTTPIAGFFQPFCLTCFSSDQNVLYYCFFHKTTMMHYHFLFDIKAQSVVSELVQFKMQGTIKNFPQRVFYNSRYKQFNVFYRQGITLTVDEKNIGGVDTTVLDKIINFDLGDLVMWKSQVLITRSSNVIKFFKQELCEIEDRKIWKEYYEIASCGFVSTNRYVNKF